MDEVYHVTQPVQEAAVLSSGGISAYIESECERVSREAYAISWHRTIARLLEEANAVQAGK